MPKSRVKQFAKKHNTAIIRIIGMILSSFALAYLTEWVVRNNFLSLVSWAISFPGAFFITSVFLFFFQFFLFTLFRRIDFPFLITGILTFAMATATHFKNTYRSEPLYPWDLKIVSEAADISGEMDLTPTSSMIISAIVIFIIFASLFVLHIVLKRRKIFRYRKPNKKRIIQLTVQSISSIAVLLCYVFLILYNSSIMSFFGIKESAFRQSACCKRNGIIQSFIMNTKYISPEKPEDYSLHSVSEAVSAVKKSPPENCTKPNIIYLMSESYADISLCKNVTYNDDIFGCTDYLKDNFVSGTLVGAQYGGGTCNSEFEVLTGFSMTFLPSGCTPYQQYFNKETVSYPRFLKELGYTTVAIHSYGKQFWNRDIAYPNMGFDKFVSEEDFIDPMRRRGLIKDDELIGRIITEYEENLSTGKPFFNFSVSMQNHGAFTDGQYLENYRAGLSCDKLTAEQNGILTTYATGIRDANIALDKLIGYFSEINEPTIICMFGDHLGSLGGSDEIYINSGYMNDPEKGAEDMAKKYSTPFFIWDNFTNNNFVAEKMSFYQLIPSICDWYSLQKPAFFDYLSEEQKYIRGCTALGLFIDKDGKASYKMPDNAKKYFYTHSLLQYDLMFGEKYSLKKIYSAK